MMNDPEVVRLALETATVGLWSFNATTLEMRWNPRMHLITGCSEPLTPERYESHIHPDDRMLVARSTRESLSAGQFTSASHRFTRPDGNIRWVHNSGSMQMDGAGKLQRIAGVTIDVTEQRQLEDSYRVSHRLETVGELAGDISNNFRNILAALLPSIEFARIAASGEARAALDDALDAAHRAALLVKEMSRWTQTDNTFALKTVPLDDLVGRVVHTARQFFDPRFCIELALESPNCLVKGQVDELEQSLMTLLVNARDALDTVEQKAPCIRVSTGRVSQDTLRIRVEDNGPGIAPDLHSRIFKPFFTTKPMGQGVGMALSAAMTAIKHHGGSIRFVSPRGQGATFEIFLPTVKEEPKAVPQPRAHDTGEVVLIVDDEAPVRRAVGALLERHGYGVRNA
jgi:PAS domain S-box-containing protein